MIVYCSVNCYKAHKDRACSAATTQGSSATTQGSSAATVDPGISQSRTSGGIGHKGTFDAKVPSPLRPLTSLKWPYIPEEPSYEDPLKRNDPKPLRMHQYEAIATSPAVRKALTAHPSLPVLLRQIDALRGQEREDALQEALGVGAADDLGLSASRHTYGRSSEPLVKTDEERDALRALAEAVESAVRGGQDGVLGLDWEGGT